MLWALLCGLDTPAPCTHVHHQYEEPLVAVLWERYVVCGSLLDGVTYDTLATRTGWYFYDAKKPREHQRNRRVDVPAARAHHQPLQRREAHGRVHGDPAVDGREGAPPAEVTRHETQPRDVRAQVLRGAQGHVLMARTVKPVPTDPLLEIQRVRHGVGERRGGNVCMERRVEHRDLRHAREHLLRGLDAREVHGVVNRREARALADGLLHRGVDAHRQHEALAAVHHPVPHGEDLPRGPPRGERREHRAQGLAVRRRVHRRLPRRAVDDAHVPGVGAADALHAARREARLGVHLVEVVLDRRRARVQHQDLHGPKEITGFGL
jgi:hypothetical protein